MYVTGIDYIYGKDLQCLIIISNDIEVQRKILGHVRFSWINEFISKDRVYGLTNKKFVDCKVSDAYVKGKQNHRESHDLSNSTGSKSTHGENDEDELPMTTSFSTQAQDTSKHTPILNENGIKSLII